MQQGGSHQRLFASVLGSFDGYKRRPRSRADMRWTAISKQAVALEEEDDLVDDLGHRLLGGVDDQVGVGGGLVRIICNGERSALALVDRDESPTHRCQ